MLPRDPQGPEQARGKAKARPRARDLQEGPEWGWDRVVQTMDRARD